MAKARKRAGYSSRGLSRAVGASESTVRQIEAGRSKDPGAALVARIAEVLRVRVEWLVSGRGRMTLAASRPAAAA